MSLTPEQIAKLRQWQQADGGPLSVTNATMDALLSAAEEMHHYKQAAEVEASEHRRAHAENARLREALESVTEQGRYTVAEVIDALVKAGFGRTRPGALP